MTSQEILETLTRILRDVLGDESIVLSLTTTRPDIPRWDSFAYINFIIAVEVEFNIKFKLSDIEAFASIGDIVAAIKMLR